MPSKEQNRQTHNSSKQKILCLTGMLILAATTACLHRTVHVAAATTGASNDNSFLDLTPGGRLRIVVPVLNSGKFQVAISSQQAEGNSVVLSAANLAGYEVSYYSIDGQTDGNVRLQFTSAEITQDGKTTMERSAPKLSFLLPAKKQHVRLIYLVSHSQSDHNMAITASKNVAALNLFTERVRNDPSVCKSDGDVFCSWVPAGIAVRPELLPSSK